MNKLNLDIINATSPYNVVQLEDLPFYFYFHTDFNIDYEISIKPNDAFIRNGAYVLRYVYLFVIVSQYFPSLVGEGLGVGSVSF
jgi:hypothetical protein